MNDREPLVARYQHLRQVSMRVNHALVERLSRDLMQEGARALGLLRKGVLVFDTEDEMAVLMDFCIHDVRRQGRNTVDDAVAESPYPPGSDEAVVLEALQRAHYSVFLSETLRPGVGVRVRDVVGGESLLIVDIGFSRSAEPGMLLAARLFAPEGICMTTGAALPVGMAPAGDLAEVAGAVEELKACLGGARTPEERSEATATVIRTCLRAGAASHISYGEPGGGVGPSAPPARPHLRRPSTASRYAPCPCGSGKKFKFCCGARR